MSTAIVLGGGISGLSAAYYLSKLRSLPGSPFTRVVLCESSNRLGGWLHSLRHDDGTIYELGPNSIRLDGKPRSLNILRLLTELGIDKQILPISVKHPSAGRRFIQANGKLHPFNVQGISYLYKNVFHSSLLKLIVKDMFTPSAAQKDVEYDESVHAFAERRFGIHTADYLLDALCIGIYAGDSKLLSVRSALPDLYKFELTDGGVIKGLVKSILSKKKIVEMSEEELLMSKLPDHSLNGDTETYKHLYDESKNERWVMWSLKGGLQTLVDGLEKALQENDSNVQLLTNSMCTNISFTNDGVKVRIGNEGREMEGSHLFSSLPAHSLSMLMPGHSTLTQKLSNIPTVSVALVHLEFNGTMPQVPQGFGYLIPSCESSKLLGVIFSSHLFPQHGSDNTRLLCMLGGAWSDERLGSSIGEDDLVESCLSSLPFPVEKPVRQYVTILRDCIPQYHVGHAGLVNEMQGYINDNSLPLTLLGASYHGVSINDCIYNSKLGVLQTLVKHYSQD